MKRRILTTFTLLLVALLTLALASCDKKKTDDSKESERLTEAENSKESESLKETEGSEESERTKEPERSTKTDESTEFENLTNLEDPTRPEGSMEPEDLKESEGLEYREEGSEYSVVGIGICSDRKIVIPATYKGKPVTGIGTYAFSGCKGLTSITIPDSVKSIGEGAFERCVVLTSIAVSSGNTVYHSQGNCLIDTKNKELIVGCKTSIVPIDEYRQSCLQLLHRFDFNYDSGLCDEYWQLCIPWLRWFDLYYDSRQREEYWRLCILGL